MGDSQYKLSWSNHENIENILTTRDNIITTYLMLCKCPFLWFCCPNSYWGMDYTRPLKMYCGTLHQDINMLSFKFQDRDSMDWTFLSRSREFGGQVNISKSLLENSNHSWTIPLTLRQSTKRGQPSVSTVLMKGSAACQNNIHMYGRTQGFPAEYYPKHHTARQLTFLP